MRKFLDFTVSNYFKSLFVFSFAELNSKNNELKKIKIFSELEL